MFDRYKELEKECKLKKKEITDLETELKNLSKSIKESDKEKDSLDAELLEIESSIIRFDQKLSFLDSNIEKQNKTLRERKDLYENNQRQLRAVLKGDKVIPEESFINLNNQMKEAEVNLANTISEIKQNDVKRKHLESEIN